MTFRIALLGVVAAAICFSPTHPTFAQRMAEKHIRSHAEMGQTVRIRGHVNYEHNCSEVIPTTISVIHVPQHGTLDVRNENVRATDPDLGYGSKCAGVGGGGKGVYYTRTGQGADSFAYDSISGNGVVHLHVIVQ
ncbi:MAG: hypothetical protein WCF81_21050 [Roseiarcus sp.]